MIKKMLQKIKCAIPFNFDYFGHKNVIIVRKFCDNEQLIQCVDCGKLFGINHSVKAILPWDDVKDFYER